MSSDLTHRATRGFQLELTPEQKRDLEEAFRLFDYEGVGAIDPKELIIAYRALGFEPKKDELKRVIQEYEDANGKIPLAGFMAIFTMKMCEAPTLDEVLKGYKVGSQVPSESFACMSAIALLMIFVYIWARHTATPSFYSSLHPMTSNQALQSTTWPDSPRNWARPQLKKSCRRCCERRTQMGMVS